MKNCTCKSEECNGTVNRYEIHSPSKNTIYPNRFWGITDYCNFHKEDDEKNGFILTVKNNEENTFIL